MQEQPAPHHKLVSVLKESMIRGDPFPKFHGKAAETKYMVEPVSAFLKSHRGNGKVEAGEFYESMVQLLDWSREIDVVIDGMDGFGVDVAKGELLETLVHNYNVLLTKVCHVAISKGVFLFNFIPKNHYLFHLAQKGRLMSPKLAWCYQGEDLMQKVKTMAQGSFQATLPRKLGSKILAKYLVAMDLELSQLP